MAQTKTKSKPKQTTYRLTCKNCQRSYQTDKKRGATITKLLKKDPNYLKNYKCRSCSKGTPVAVESKVSDKGKKIELRPIDIDDSLNDFIPKTCEKYYNRHIGKVKDEDILKYHLNSKNPLMKNILLTGETGVGKTLLIRSFCMKNKLPYYRIVMNAGTTVEDIIGQNVMDEEGRFKFVYQVLIKFMKHGGVFVFDEINAGQKEILHILNSITDFERKAIVTQHKGEVIEACDNFLVVACMNPPDEYNLNEMSKSLKSRFTPYYFDFDEKIDEQVLKDEKLLKFTKAVRLARVNKQLETPLSIRDLVQFQNIRTGLGYPLAKEMLINKFNNGEKEVIKTMIEVNLEKSKILNKKNKEQEGAQ